MTVATRPETITPEDLLRMPDNSGMELVDGHIVEKNVSLILSDTEAQITTLLRNKLANVKVLPSSMGYRCFKDEPSRVRKPDVSAILLTRLKQIGQDDFGYAPIVPDLAVEVASPRDEMHDINEKLREYREADFPLVWQVDPEARTITVYALGAKPLLLSGDDPVTLPAISPDFRCKAADLFPTASTQATGT